MRQIVIHSDGAVEQFRFPRSKKRRIRLKWAMRPENWRETQHRLRWLPSRVDPSLGWWHRVPQMLVAVDFAAPAGAVNLNGDAFSSNSLRAGELSVFVAARQCGKTDIIGRIVQQRLQQDAAARDLPAEPVVSMEMSTAYFERMEREMVARLVGSSYSSTNESDLPSAVEEILERIKTTQQQA